jgi:uncharacterized membrane protein YphA (DoxX/SURF4 family)
MKNMEDSMAHPLQGARSMDLPGWKAVLSHTAGALLALLFLTSGVWKLTDPFRWTTMLEQLLVPYWLSMPLTLAVGIAETFAGILILVPRFRRWGSSLVALLLLAFMIYFAINYATLTGKECSCFPWVKRTVGPGFFVGDAAMLLLAFVAGVWAAPSRSIRSAAVVLGAIVVFAGALYGVNAARQSGTAAPATITVDGQPYSLEHGKVFLFFYDPECMHCDRAARTMASYNWRDTRVVAIPTREQHFAKAFLSDTGLKAGTSLESERLKKVFPFGDPPYGVALENGHERSPLSRFDENEPAATLRKLGFIE